MGGYAQGLVLDMLQEEEAAWINGITSFEIAEKTKLSIGMVRRTLRELEREGYAYPCAPRKYQRLDGKTANTLVWYRRKEDR